MDKNGPEINTDEELWRETEGDYYADSIHATQDGGIGINVGGLVYVRTLSQWHELATYSGATRNPMSTAPKDGTTIEVFARGEWFSARYHDCQGMRDDPDVDDILDAWTVLDDIPWPSDIELSQAMGWRKCL